MKSKLQQTGTSRPQDDQFAARVMAQHYSSFTFLSLRFRMYVLTSWTRVPYSQRFMEPKGSLPHSQVPANSLSISSQINAVRVFPFHFLKIHLNIILPSTPVSSKWSPSIRFPNENPVYTSILPHICYMYRPSHSLFITRTILIEQYRSLSSSLCSFLHYPVTSSLLGTNIPLALSNESLLLKAIFR